MLNKLVLAGLLALSALTTFAEPPPDMERGKLLYENECTECHESQVHIRKNHKARSLGDIQWQAIRWSREKKLEWSGSDVNDVSWFLYKQYYGGNDAID